MFGDIEAPLEPPEVYADQLEAVLQTFVSSSDVLAIYGSFYTSWNRKRHGVVLNDPSIETMAMLAMRVSTLIIDADNIGNIDPPLAVEQKSRFIARYVSNSSLIERHQRAVRYPDRQFGLSPKVRHF